MSPTIWGFDLSELSWSAFSSKNMFDKRWPYRRERVIAYQLAMNICLAAECTATYSLSKYEDLQTHIEGAYPGSHLYNNDIIDSQIVCIVFNVLVATLFGADMFFLVQYPRRVFPKWYNWTKKVLAVLILLGVFAGALAGTIIVARHSAILGHVPPEVAQDALALYFRPPLEYHLWPVNIAWIVLQWLGVIVVLASTIYMWVGVAHDEKYGVEPKGSTTFGDVEKLTAQGNFQQSTEQERVH